VHPWFISVSRIRIRIRIRITIRVRIRVRIRIRIRITIRVRIRIRIRRSTIVALEKGVPMLNSGKDGLHELLEGKKTPDFSLQGSDGRAHALKDYAGRKAVLEFLRGL